MGLEDVYSNLTEETRRNWANLDPDDQWRTAKSTAKKLMDLTPFDVMGIQPPFPATQAEREELLRRANAELRTILTSGNANTSGNYNFTPAMEKLLSAYSELMDNSSGMGWEKLDLQYKDKAVKDADQTAGARTLVKNLAKLYDDTHMGQLTVTNNPYRSPDLYECLVKRQDHLLHRLKDENGSEAAVELARNLRLTPRPGHSKNAWALSQCSPETVSWYIDHLKRAIEALPIDATETRQRKKQELDKKKALTAIRYLREALGGDPRCKRIYDRKYDFQDPPAPASIHNYRWGDVAGISPHAVEPHVLAYAICKRQVVWPTKEKYKNAGSPYRDGHMGIPPALPKIRSKVRLTYIASAACGGLAFAIPTLMHHPLIGLGAGLLASGISLVTLGSWACNNLDDHWAEHLYAEIPIDRVNAMRIVAFHIREGMERYAKKLVDAAPPGGIINRLLYKLVWEKRGPDGSAQEPPKSEVHKYLYGERPEGELVDERVSDIVNRAALDPKSFEKRIRERVTEEETARLFMQNSASPTDEEIQNAVAARLASEGEQLRNEQLSVDYGDIEKDLGCLLAKWGSLRLIDKVIAEHVDAFEDPDQTALSIGQNQAVRLKELQEEVKATLRLLIFRMPYVNPHWIPRRFLQNFTKQDLTNFLRAMVECYGDTMSQLYQEATWDPQTREMEAKKAVQGFREICEHAADAMLYRVESTFVTMVRKVAAVAILTGVLTFVGPPVINAYKHPHFEVRKDEIQKMIKQESRGPKSQQNTAPAQGSSASPGEGAKQEDYGGYPHW